MLKKTYKTNRLFLVQPSINMAEQIVDFYSRNKDFFKAFDPYRTDAFYKAAAHKDIIKRELEEVKSGRMLKFWIYKIEDKKRIIGMINFANIVKGVFLSTTVGYKLDEYEQHKGYMTEALHAAIVIVFKEVGLHRVEANIMPHNKPSIELVKRLGFQYEGLSKKYLKINGKWEDHIHMAILNDEI